MEKAVDYKALADFIKKYPDTSYKDFKKSGIRASTWTYYKFRQTLKKNPDARGVDWDQSRGNGKVSDDILRGFKATGKTRERYVKIAEYLMKHPNASNSEINEIPGVKIGSSSLSYFKSRFLSKPATTRSSTRKAVYLKVFSVPSADVNLKAKELLRSFVECLNNSKRTRMEVVEYVDPPEIEVRELS